MCKKALLIPIAAFILVALACRLPGTSTVPPGALETAIAQTVETQLVTFEPTDAPLPGETETPPPAVMATSTPSSPTQVTHTPTPFVTPHVPTDTPATPPTRTPIPCLITIAPEFEPRLNAHPDILLALGCPAGERQQTRAAEQRFQHGRMFWQQDSGLIHIVYDTGTFQIEPDQYIEGDPEYDCPEVGPPPAGLVMPKRGFGWQWCNTAGVRDALGWALEEEVGYKAVRQKFEQGHVFQSRANHIFVYYDNGAWDHIE